MQYPSAMQPTHARWESVSQPAEPSKNTAEDLTTDFPSLRLTNGISKTENHPSPREPSPNQPSDTIFSPIPAIYARNFMIEDIHYESPSDSSLGIPGPDINAIELGANGLISDDQVHGKQDISSLIDTSFNTSSILAELPPDCRAAYREAAERECLWKRRWERETDDGMRSETQRSYLWFP